LAILEHKKIHQLSQNWWLKNHWAT